MTLVERLEAAVQRLEQLTEQPRYPEWRLGYRAMVLQRDGSVKVHWTHPSFGEPLRHDHDDACPVMPLAEAIQDDEHLDGVAFG